MVESTVFTTRSRFANLAAAVETAVAASASGPGEPGPGPLLDALVENPPTADPREQEFLSGMLAYVPRQPVLWDDYYKPFRAEARTPMRSMTGFGRVMHNVLGRLQDDFEIHHLGINYHGDPHDAGWRILFVPGAEAVHHDQLGTDAAARRLPPCRPTHDRYRKPRRR